MPHTTILSPDSLPLPTTRQTLYDASYTKSRALALPAAANSTAPPARAPNQRAAALPPAPALAPPLFSAPPPTLPTPPPAPPSTDTLQPPAPRHWSSLQTSSAITRAAALSHYTPPPIS